MFNLDEKFIDTLSSDELEQLQAAHGIMQKVSAKYNEWQNGYSDEGLRQHLQEVAAKQREEMQNQDRLRSHFK